MSDHQPLYPTGAPGKLFPHVCACVHVHSLGGPSQPYLVLGVSLPGAGDCFINPSTLNPKLGGFGGRREPESSIPVTSSGLFLQGGEIFLLPVG